MTNPTPQQAESDIMEQRYEAVASMDIPNLMLVDRSCDGYHIRVGAIYPELAIIFKTMLLNAIDGRLQKLTVEFDDLTAYTTLKYPGNL